MVYRQSKNQTKFRSCLALASSGKITDSDSVTCLFNFRCRNDCGCSECLADEFFFLLFAGKLQAVPTHIHKQYSCAILNDYDFRRVRINYRHSFVRPYAKFQRTAQKIFMKFCTNDFKQDETIETLIRTGQKTPAFYVNIYTSF
jgi:hypothetical protein